MKEKIKWYQRINPLFWLELYMSHAIAAAIYGVARDSIREQNNQYKVEIKVERKK